MAQTPRHRAVLYILLNPLQPAPEKMHAFSLAKKMNKQKSPAVFTYAFGLIWKS